MSKEKKSVPDQDKPQIQLAEVITASITTLIAETGSQIHQHQHQQQHRPGHSKTHEAGGKPRFGSFIRIDSPENGLALFAVVFDVITNPPDSVHKPSALGLTREKLRQEQPHIFALLKTQVHAQIIGFRESASNDDSAVIYQHLPPQPPEVHDFVYRATEKETIRLTSNFEFLRLLTQVSSPPADELIAAAVREAAQAREGEARERYLIEAGRAITQLFRSDYEHMLSIVRKIKPQQSK